MAKVDLSIIVLSYNTLGLTKKCVKSVLSSLDKDSSIHAELIVLDNASTDGSPEMLQKIKDKRVRPIISKENLGFTKGNNKAAKDAKGTYILLLNSDIEVLGDAIPNLYHWFTSSNYDFGGGKLLNTDKSVQKSVGRFYSLPIAFVSLFLKGDSLGITRYSPAVQTDVDWLSGACIITKKNTYNSINGFDEKIFMYWDEVDLFYRAAKKEYSTGFYPKAEFIHHEGKSSKSRTEPILKVYEGYIYFYKKHHSRLHLLLLRFMLKLKALLSLVIGFVTFNQYLITTYKKAYEIA